VSKKAVQKDLNVEIRERLPLLQTASDKVIVLLFVRCHPLQAIYCWPYVIESRLNDTKPFFFQKGPPRACPKKAVQKDLNVEIRERLPLLQTVAYEPHHPNLFDCLCVLTIMCAST
jgi:hypothetical protein